MLPILIGSHPNSHWLPECLESIRNTTPRPVLVHEDGGYEPFALRKGLGWGRFLFLQDSVQILSPAFWDVIDSLGPTWLFGHPPMFMGVFDSTDLIPHLPTGPVDKETSIALETELSHTLGYPYLWPDVRDGNALRREIKHGRDNLVVGNDLIVKWKGTFR